MAKMKDMEDNSTKAEKKILLQFQRVTETDKFNIEVTRIRSLLNIPINGIEPTRNDLKNLSDKFRLPDNFPINKTNNKVDSLRILRIETNKINNLLPIDNVYLLSLVKNYILFNKFFYNELENLKNYFHNTNACKIEDAQEEFDELAINDDPDSSFNIRDHIDKLEERLWRYPVVIRIHQDASQRDIVEYIKKHWKDIKNYQDLYIKENTSFRNSKTKENIQIKERNDFIYKNKNLQRKKIMTMVTDKFNEPLDYGHISKIISLKNKRKKV